MIGRKDGKVESGSGEQQSSHVESAAASASSSVSSTRHNGHAQARSHTVKPQRAAGRA